MSQPSTISPALANGGNASGRVQVNSAELVGSQFVSQFYTVLHTSPNYLYRFYTDESTVTHADGGTETEPPSSVTVATQRHISERVQAMGFQEATTEIWSVDSQYSKDNGVMVLVTGSLQCKGKKKRDFVQSFFLAVQEKGYFVLNDTFRYLSVNHSRQSQSVKENGYHQSFYDKPQSAYNQQSYYPAPAQHQNPQQSAAAIYSSHPTAANYSSSLPLTASSQARSELVRGHAVTPSILPNRTVPQPPKPVGPASQPTQQPQAAAAAPSPAPASTSEVAPLPAAQQDASQMSISTGSQTAPAPAEKPKPEAVSKPASAEAAAPHGGPVAQPKAVAKPEAKAERQALPAEQALQKEPENAAPSAPLTYADRLKLGSRSSAPKNVPATGPIAPPVAAAATATPKPAAPKESESPVEAATPAEMPEASAIAANGTVVPLPEEALTTSIFVRSLPEGTTQEKLEEAFARFGNIKGVSLKQQPKGKGDFAFLEFEEVAAMQAAIQAKVIIDGKTVTVMERKPMISKHSRGPFQGGERGGRGEGRGFRPGRDSRGRGGRGEGRPFTGGRTDRGEGSGGRGRSFSGNFNGEARLDGSKPAFEGKPEGGRGRGEGRGRGRNVNRQPPPQSRPEQA